MQQLEGAPCCGVWRMHGTRQSCGCPLDTRRWLLAQPARVCGMARTGLHGCMMRPWLLTSRSIARWQLPAPTSMRSTVVVPRAMTIGRMSVMGTREKGIEKNQSGDWSPSFHEGLREDFEGLRKNQKKGDCQSMFFCFNLLYCQF